MKKIISLILVIGMLLCLCACAVEIKNKPTNDVSSQASQNDVTSNVNSNEEEASKFTVTVVDQNGDPVADALVKICQAETCLMPMPTDENGVVMFNFELSDGHKIALEGCPEGYETEFVGDNYTYIDDGEKEFTFEITKK